VQLEDCNLEALKVELHLDVEKKAREEANE
jgi:hypothetical protein